MFKTTYGLVRNQIRKNACSFVHKAVDFERDTELCAVGSVFGEDAPFEGIVYCLRHGGKIIPFIARDESTVSFSQLSGFRVIATKQNLAARIPIVSVAISHFGGDLSSIKGGFRCHVSYMNVWNDSPVHEYKFQSESERRQIFSYIQESLPVLMFDFYSSMRSSPKICKKVRLRNGHESLKFDSTGRPESASIRLKTSHKKIPDSREFLNKIEKRDSNIPFSFEEIVSELIELESEILFFGSSAYPFSIVESDKLWSIFRRIYHHEYRDFFPSYEVFVVRLAILIRGRLTGRQLFELSTAKP